MSDFLYCTIFCPYCEREKSIDLERCEEKDDAEIWEYDFECCGKTLVVALMVLPKDSWIIKGHK